jgi:hypothetical protein
MFRKVDDWYATDGDYNICKICVSGEWRYELWRLAKKTPKGNNGTGSVRLQTYIYGLDDDLAAKKAAIKQACEDAEKDRKMLGMQDKPLNSEDSFGL